MQQNQSVQNQFPWIWLVSFLLSGFLLFLTRESVFFSFQKKTPLPFQEVSEKGSTLKNSIYASFSGNLDLMHALTIHFPGKQETKILIPIQGINPPVFILLPVEKLSQPPWSGEVKPLAKLPQAQEILKKQAQEEGGFTRIEISSLQASSPDGLVFPKQVISQQGKQTHIQADSVLKMDVLFPQEVRILLRKPEFSSPQLAAKEVDKLRLPHGPAVETPSGFGFVLRLPSDETERELALKKIQDNDYPYEGFRIESYEFPASVVEFSKAQDGILIPGPDKLKQPARYQTISTLRQEPRKEKKNTEERKGSMEQASQNNRNFTQQIVSEPGFSPTVSLEMGMEHPEKTFIPFSNMYALYVRESFDLTNAKILLVDESPDKTRLWAWPLVGFCVFIMISFVVVLVRFFVRKKNDSTL